MANTSTAMYNTVHHSQCSKILNLFALSRETCLPPGQRYIKQVVSSYYITTWKFLEIEQALENDLDSSF